MELNEEMEKNKNFELELSQESDFIKKIKDIFKLQYFEKLQDILILQKHQFLEQIEQEVLYILKKLYSEQIILNAEFNSLFNSCFKDFQSKYNTEYREIHSKFDFFLRLKTKSLKSNNNTDIEALNYYYIPNFRRHCLNHTGPALHKCGHAEKGKFIKIALNSNNKNFLINETTYIICEECKKVFTKDLFNNYCSYCKESYLCSIVSLKENKDSFLITYSNPHCDTFINRTIPCKLCKEKLYLFISDKKIKCIKCNYIIDIGSKNEFNWQCPKCNKYFKSNIKFYNPSENLILTKILKKALLLKIKAKPQFISCCKIDINETPFLHKKECKGLLYLCNAENYFLKNKKWVIVCEKCQAINNCKNFIWTCPKCNKRIRETNNDYDYSDDSYKKDFEYFNKKNIGNIIGDKKDDKDINKNENITDIVNSNANDNKNVNIENDNNNNNAKSNLNKKYFSEHRLKPSYSQLMIKENAEKKYNIENNNLRKSANEKKSEIVLISRMNRIDKDNLKLNVIKNDKVNNNNNSNNNNNNLNNTNNRCYILHKRRNYQVTPINNINNLKNNEEKNIIPRPNIITEKEEKNNIINNNNKDNNNYNNKSFVPFPRVRYSNNSNKINNLKNNYNNKEEEKNDKKVLRCESYKSNLLKENVPNKEEEKIKINEKNNLAFKINNRSNIPFRLKYNSKNKNNNNQNLKDSFDELNNNNIIEKNNEEFLVKKNLIYNSVDIGCNSKKSSNENEPFSKETTSHCSKGSVNSLSKEVNINTNNSKMYMNLNLKQSDINSPNDKENNKERNSVSPIINFNFKNKRRYYREEKEKYPSNNVNINVNPTEEKNNIRNNENENKNIISINKDTSIKYKPKNYASPNHKLTFLEKKQQERERVKFESRNNYKKNNIDKPDDVIEPDDIDFSKDIQINDSKIKKNKSLYSEIQTGIKKILEKGRLPQFNIDNYTIEKKIGDGAFGVLFSVSNNKTKKKYALKKLTATDLTSLEDFQKEFEIAYKNNHENILNLYGICVRVYDVTTYILFVLMDLAEHDWEIEINNRFKEKKFYTETELINILKQLTSACVYLQKREIAHRDIKPENILLFFESTPPIYKICDFGEAKEKIRVGSRHKSIRGTDYYMSPILFKGLMEKEKFVRDDPYKSDVFSLGYCILIAAVLDFEFINKIRKVEEQRQIDRIIREALEERYSYKFIYVLLKMIVHSEKERIDFLGLEKLIREKL